MTFLYGITLVLHFEVSRVKFRCYHLVFWYNALMPIMVIHTALTGIWSFHMITVIGRK